MAAETPARAEQELRCTSVFVPIDLNDTYALVEPRIKWLERQLVVQREKAEELALENDDKLKEVKEENKHLTSENDELTSKLRWLTSENDGPTLQNDANDQTVKNVMGEVEQEEETEILDQDDEAGGKGYTPADGLVEEPEPERRARPPAIGGGLRPKTRRSASASTVGQESEKPVCPRSQFITSIPKQRVKRPVKIGLGRVNYSGDEKISLVLAFQEHHESKTVWCHIRANKKYTFHEKRTAGDLRDLYRTNSRTAAEANFIKAELQRERLSAQTA